jgi:hypothetical protein
MTSKSREKIVNVTIPTTNIDLRNYSINPPSLLKSLQLLYSNEVLYSLLKNDCVLFGDMIIDFLHYNTLNYNKQLCCFADIGIKNIIERDLYGKLFIKEKKYSSNAGFHYSIYNYKCSCGKESSHIYNLKMIYVTDVKKISSLILEETFLFNLDTFTINRRGFKILQMIDEHYEMIDICVPSPMFELLEFIRTKKFQIISKITKSDTITRVLNLITDGWINISSKISIKKGSLFQDKLCEICHDKITKKSVISELICGHFFHTKCWHENLKHSITSTADIIECPCCRKEYYLYQVL